MSIKAMDFVNGVETAYHEKWGYIWAQSGAVWTEAKQKALTDKYNSDPKKYSDYYQGAVYGSKWIGRRVIDCSGLVKRFAEKLGLKGIYHGSNSQFNKNCSITGKIEKGVKIPVGALIFTGKEVGQHNHVGILVTESCVCEAKGTTAGVVHTPLSNKKWTYWGLLKGIDYTFEPGVISQIADNSAKVSELVTIKTAHSTLRRGAKGEEVTLLQTLLAKAGSTLQIDGIFGVGTLSAVKTFQKKHGLVVDGIVGPKTWGELDKLSAD